MLSMLDSVDGLYLYLRLDGKKYTLYLALLRITFDHFCRWYRWWFYINPMNYQWASGMSANYYNTSFAPYCAPNGFPCWPYGVTGADILASFPELDSRIWVNMTVLTSEVVFMLFLLWLAVALSSGRK
jgi:hypothetical protein